MKRMLQGGVILALAKRTHREIGAVGERWLAEALERQGYRVAYTGAGEKRGDLVVVDVVSGEVRKIEVKTARRAKDGKWRFTLVKDGCTSHLNADLVALLAVMESGRVVPFIMPVEAVKQQRQAVITSHPERYAGKLARWRMESQQIVQVPVAWSMTKQAQHFAEELGNMPKIQEMRDKEHEEAKAKLNTCFEGGFTLLSTVVVEVTSRTLLMYTLHKPDKSG